MSSAAERAIAVDELVTHERVLRTLLSMVEAPVTDLDGLVRAAQMFAALRFDADDLVARFEDAPAAEITQVKRRLARLVDLEAVTRSACARELEKTAAKMDRVRRFRTQLDSMQSVEHLGETLDYTS